MIVGHRKDFFNPPAVQLFILRVLVREYKQLMVAVLLKLQVVMIALHRLVSSWVIIIFSMLHASIAILSVIIPVMVQLLKSPLILGVVLQLMVFRTRFLVYLPLHVGILEYLQCLQPALF